MSIPNEGEVTLEVVETPQEAEPAMVPAPVAETEPPAETKDADIQYGAPGVTLTGWPFTDRADDENRLSLDLPRLSSPEMDSHIGNLPKKDFTQYEDDRAWAMATTYALRTQVRKGVYLAELNSPTAKWGQFIQVEGRNVAAVSHGFNPTGGKGAKVSGDRAVSLVRSLMGGGENRSSPMFGSGFWVTLKPDADTAISDLETRVNLEKEQIGLDSGGMVLSNTAVYLVKHAFDFIVDNTVSCTISDFDPNRLGDVMLASDLHHIALQMGATIHPKPYPVSLPCSIDPVACNHVEEVSVNVRFMVTHDEEKLTSAQKLHMSDQLKMHTYKEVMDYQAQGPASESETVTVQGGNITVAFRNPTVNQYIEDGYAWITGIRDVVDTLFKDVDEAHRNKLIEDRARLTTLRQYTHYIKHLVIKLPDDQQVIIDSRETIRANLEDMSKSQAVVDAVIAGVRRHIERTTVSIVGVPKTKCPKCQTELSDEEKRHPSMIPLEPIRLFFNLLFQSLTTRQSTKLIDV